MLKLDLSYYIANLRIIVDGEKIALIANDNVFSGETKVIDITQADADEIQLKIEEIVKCYEKKYT